MGQKLPREKIRKRIKKFNHSKRKIHSNLMDLVSLLISGFCSNLSEFILYCLCLLELTFLLIIQVVVCQAVIRDPGHTFSRLETLDFLNHNVLSNTTYWKILQSLNVAEELSHNLSMLVSSLTINLNLNSVMDKILMKTSVETQRASVKNLGVKLLSNPPLKMTLTKVIVLVRKNVALT